MTIPSPPPTFTVTLVGLLNSGRTPPVTISFPHQNPDQTLMQRPIVAQGNTISVSLEAGFHQAVLTSATGISTIFEIRADQQREIMVPA